MLKRAFTLIELLVAIAKNARALPFDEPTSGLASRAGHDLFNAKECGTRIGILHRGRLVDSVDADAVTASDLEARFLRATSQETSQP